MGFNYFLIFLKRKIFKKRYLAVCVFLAGFYYYNQLLHLPDGQLHVRFLNVGQGDATLVTTVKGSQILIDGGPSNNVSSFINQYSILGDKNIDLILLTHPHADHVAGLTAVLRNYNVKNIIYNPMQVKSLVYKDFLDAVELERGQGAKILSVKTGDKITIGDLVLKIFWVPQVIDTGNLNNDSIITLMSYKDFDVFMPGDAEEKEAASLIATGVKITPVEVLKAAHHGSRNGLNQEIMTQLSPKLTVISAGKNNSYGHPHLELLNLLRNLGSKVLRTDLDGTIDVVSDGESWGVR